MAFYPQSILDEIRDRISISSYIGEHIPLKKAGRNFKGLCPFHSEKTSSFMVSDEKEIFHCFGCGEGGNIFTFVMKFDGLSFSEAVEHLAGRASVALPKNNFSKQEIDKTETIARKKKLLLKINKFVAEFFRANLVQGPRSEQARNYLKSRGILSENSTQHFLGYADDNWDALYKHLEQSKVPLQLAEELGLLRKNRTGEYFDLFRGRLIFPIVSPRKEVLGFGGRIISGDTKDNAKYINSPDSMIYHKSHSVYGLNVAQQDIRQLDRVIIVEGYMDALALNEAHIGNVVAPLGTALTSGHIRLLGRYTKNMVLIFDGDSAGINAAERSLPSFMEAGLMPKIVVLPDGDDPDDWIKKNSKEEFETLLDKSDTLLAWFIKRRSSLAQVDPARKFKLVSELKPFFNNLKDAVEFKHYRRLISDEFKIDEGDLTAKFEYHGQSSKSESGHVAGRIKTERILLMLMLEYPELIKQVSDSIDSSFLSDESFRTIFELLVDESKNGRVIVGRLIDRVADDELVGSINTLSAGNRIKKDDSEEALADCLKYLNKTKVSEQLKAITVEIKNAEKNNDEGKILKLITEKNKLIAQAL